MEAGYRPVRSPDHVRNEIRSYCEAFRRTTTRTRVTGQRNERRSGDQERCRNMVCCWGKSTLGMLLVSVWLPKSSLDETYQAPICKRGLAGLALTNWPGFSSARDPNTFGIASSSLLLGGFRDSQNSGPILIAFSLSSLTYDKSC